MTEPAETRPPWEHFVRSHDFFIGIDSDGCAFDTMEVKHKECFIPNIVKYYGLASVSQAMPGKPPSFSIFTRSGAA